MRLRLLLALTIAAILSQFSFAHGLVIPMSTEEVLDAFDLIVIGTIVSVERTDNEPPVFQIGVEEAVKLVLFNHTVVSAAGCDPNRVTVGSPCPSYDVGDRGLFLASESDKGYVLSFRSKVSEADCTAEQFLANYREFGPEFFWTQNGQSERFFTENPIVIHYIVRNVDLARQDYSIHFLAGTRGSEFSDVVNGTIGECVGYAIVTTSFMPSKMGTYSFNVRSGSGGSGSSGTAVIDYGSSPKEQHDAGIRGQDVWCRDGLFLILKNDGTEPVWDNDTACAALKTVEKLVERNWGFVLPESNARGYVGNR